MRKNIFILILIFLCPKAYCVSTININRAHADPIPIAITDFIDNKEHIKSTEEKNIAENLNHVINNNLKNCGIFKIIPPISFIDKNRGTSQLPDFPNWRHIGSVLLLNGSVKKISGADFEVNIILWDTITEKAIIVQNYKADIQFWRKVAHKISDQIYEKITGSKGYFDTKIAYVHEAGPRTKRKRVIAIMDQDGANHEFLTDETNMSLTPRFSPKGDKILFMSYDKTIPKVFIMDIKTKRKYLVGNFPGMSFAPQFSPDGLKAVMSIASDGATNIAEIDLVHNNIRYLTKNFSVNTSPTYSPDGKYIYFNSDRSGSKQLYVMNSDGSDPKRISSGRGSYASPSPSSDGNYIAFSKTTADLGFCIGIMRPDGSNERVIATGFLVEGPSWSPNSKTIIFTKEYPPIKGIGPRTYIHAIDISGFNEKKILTPGEASDPAWSR